VVQFRCFRNDDPPHLVAIWNESMTGRGAARLRHAVLLERSVFSKPYFDPNGLIVAVEEGQVAGFAHGGFGANPRETLLARGSGVVCVVAVWPQFRRRGIGTELLRRTEAYLKEKGAGEIYAGAASSLSPFYFGLYGGSEMRGVLDSDPGAGAFLQKRGYKPWESSLVLQRSLDRAIEVPDPRFASLRKRFDARIVPRISIGTWWQECVIGLVEPVEFRLEEKQSSKPVARAIAWEMEALSSTWNLPSVGILEFQVREEVRRQGVGKFLMVQILRYLQDQYFGLVEIQVPEVNKPGLGLCQTTGFQQIDVGRIYRKSQ
jgi:ribosomal protein S18 acetylase RimI-like enzyme